MERAPARLRTASGRVRVGGNTFTHDQTVVVRLQSSAGERYARTNAHQRVETLQHPRRHPGRQEADRPLMRGMLTAYQPTSYVEQLGAHTVVPAVVATILAVAITVGTYWVMGVSVPFPR